MGPCCWGSTPTLKACIHCLLGPEVSHRTVSSGLSSVFSLPLSSQGEEGAELFAQGLGWGGAREIGKRGQKRKRGEGKKRVGVQLSCPLHLVALAGVQGDSHCIPRRLHAPNACSAAWEPCPEWSWHPGMLVCNLPTPPECGQTHLESHSYVFVYCWVVK